MKTILRYVQFDGLEEARIETASGWYIATVERCSEEGRKKFRHRARSVQFALENAPGLLTTEPRGKAEREETK